MTYEQLAAGMSPAAVEAALRALDNIAEVDADARPGHVAYRSKRDLIDGARLAMSALRPTINQKD